jgi:tetratricopeptide (TPR) repeat protein
MDPNPARRYTTADAFAADLRRHLDGQPVLARPDTLAYRTWKLVSRYPVGSAAGVANTVLLVGLLAITTSQARNVRASSARLKAERDKAAEVTAFLTSVLTSADPYQPSGRVPTLRDVLDRGAERAAASLRDRPDVRAHLLTAMAPAYVGLGDLNRAGDMAAEAVAIRRRTLDPYSPELAASLVLVANVRLSQGRAAEAELQAREALLIQRRNRTAEPDTARILSTLGAALEVEGRLPEAEAVLRALLTVERDRRPANPFFIAQVSRNLAHVLRDLGRARDAVPLYADAYRRHRSVLGDEHPETANSAVNLGYAHFLAGDTVTAEQLLRRGVATKRRLLGIENRDVAGDQLTLATVLAARGARAEAESLRAEARAVLGTSGKR